MYQDDNKKVIVFEKVEVNTRVRISVCLNTTSVEDIVYGPFGCGTVHGMVWDT